MRPHDGERCRHALFCSLLSLGLRVTGFLVQPDALAAPATRYDAAAQVLAAVAHAVCSVVVPSGRAQSSGEAVLTTQRLAAELQWLSLDVERHAAAVRSAAAGYTAADRRASGP